MQRHPELPSVSRRVVVEGVRPEIEGGRFPIKRTVGESVTVEADAFTDGHDVVSIVLAHRRPADPEWTEVPMEPIGNDRWKARFSVDDLGLHLYTLEAWVDDFRSWFRDLGKRIEADTVTSVDLLVGAELVDAAARRAGGAAQRVGAGEDVRRLQDWAARLRGQRVCSRDEYGRMRDGLVPLVARYPDRRKSTRYDRELEVVVDREKARYGTWYELFPRSTAGEPGRHGTFRDCERLLPRIARMGFDVLYLPPIHPIGLAHRKGKNNSTIAEPDDVGSPWAIGGEDGGHKSIHAELGTLEDFRRLVEKAQELGIEVALDIAYQCSPDHPYVREGRPWFRRRPDGTVQYAENPPKKYEDIYPFDFDTEDWQALWRELRDVVGFWVEQGVRIFRVDNPHTKPFRFWEWLIADVKREHPETIFLAEAFTRPKVMQNLAKRGFTQSYTYFTWRNTAEELQRYFRELTQTEMQEYFRPNLWPNTPDILPEFLQFGGPEAFRIRLVLAATLGASYGVYGPAFELCEHRARQPRSEEYLDSEKYQIRHWDLREPASLESFIARVNAIRRDNEALQSNRNLKFYPSTNPDLLCYSKATDDRGNAVLVVVNLSPHFTHSGWVDLDPGTIGIDSSGPFQVHDLLSDARYLWRGSRNYVELNPHVTPAHVFAIRRYVRTEHDFDYFM